MSNAAHFEHYNHKTESYCEQAVELGRRAHDLDKERTLSAAWQTRIHRLNAIRWLNIQLLEEFFRINTNSPDAQWRAIISTDNLLAQMDRCADEYEDAYRLIIQMKNHAPRDPQRPLIKPDYHMVCQSDWRRV